MMSEVHAALFAFWSGFGVPAYIQGHVPDDAALPYITFEPLTADAFGQSVLTAFDWHKATNGDSANAERAELMDDIADAIPTKGKLIPLAHGFVAIRRNDGGDFQSPYDDPEDKSVLGGRTSYILHYYTF